MLSRIAPSRSGGAPPKAMEPSSFMPTGQFPRVPVYISLPEAFFDTVEDHSSEGLGNS